MSNELINQWIEYAQSNEYHPIQNINKIINFLFDMDGILSDDIYKEVVEDLIMCIRNLITEESTKEILIEYIKQDEEFKTYQGGD